MALGSSSGIPPFTKLAIVAQIPRDAGRPKQSRLRGLAFVDRSHRSGGLFLRLVASVRAEKNVSFTRCRWLLEHNRTFVRTCILNDVVARSQGRRCNTNRNDRSEEQLR